MSEVPKLVVFRASAAEAALVDNAATRLGVSKSQFIRMAITRRVEEVLAMADGNSKLSKCSETPEAGTTD